VIAAGATFALVAGFHDREENRDGPTRSMNTRASCCAPGPVRRKVQYQGEAGDLRRTSSCAAVEVLSAAIVYAGTRRPSPEHNRGFDAVVTSRRSSRWLGRRNDRARRHDALLEETARRRQ